MCLFLVAKQNSKIIKKKLKNVVTPGRQSGNGVGRDRRGKRLLHVTFYISFGPHEQIAKLKLFLKITWEDG